MSPVVVECQRLRRWWERASRSGWCHLGLSLHERRPVTRLTVKANPRQLEPPSARARLDALPLPRTRSPGHRLHL